MKTLMTQDKELTQQAQDMDSNVGQMLDFGWKWKSGWRLNPTFVWRQASTQWALDINVTSVK